MTDARVLANFFVCVWERERAGMWSVGGVGEGGKEGGEEW